MNLLLVDSSTIFRVGLRTTLANASEAADMTVIAECGDGHHACKLAVSLASDVVITDFHLPDRNGIALARELGRVAPAARVLLLAPHGPEAIVHQAIRAGATGYALKEQPPGEIVAAIRAVGRGELVLPPGISAPPPAKAERGKQVGVSLPIRAPVPARASDLRSCDLGELEQADRGESRHQHQDGGDSPRPHQRQALRSHQRRHRSSGLAVGNADAFRANQGRLDRGPSAIEGPGPEISRRPLSSTMSAW